MAPGNLRDPNHNLITNPREIPRRFLSHAAEAEFWESHAFAPGALVDGKRVRKELAELLGLEDE